MLGDMYIAGHQRSSQMEGSKWVSSTQRKGLGSIAGLGCRTARHTPSIRSLPYRFLNAEGDGTTPGSGAGSEEREDRWDGQKERGTKEAGNKEGDDGTLTTPGEPREGGEIGRTE